MHQRTIQYKMSTCFTIKNNKKLSKTRYKQKNEWQNSIYPSLLKNKTEKSFYKVKIVIQRIKTKR